MLVMQEFDGKQKMNTQWEALFQQAYQGGRMVDAEPYDAPLLTTILTFGKSAFFHFICCYTVQELPSIDI